MIDYKFLYIEYKEKKAELFKSLLTDDDQFNNGLINNIFVDEQHELELVVDENEMFDIITTQKDKLVKTCEPVFCFSNLKRFFKYCPMSKYNLYTNHVDIENVEYYYFDDTKNSSKRNKPKDIKATIYNMDYIATVYGAKYNHNSSYYVLLKSKK